MNEAMHPSELSISEYVDDTLALTERAAVERHLAECASCAALAADLRAIARDAAALPPLEPPASSWARIEEALRGPGRLGRVSGWQALAAAAVLLIAAAVGVQWGRSGAPQEEAAPPAVSAEMLAMERQYDEAFKGLEDVARADRSVLDEATGAALQKSLDLVDAAISESRAAVTAEPTSEPAQQSLIESFKMKLALLQDTVALINDLRKADAAEQNGAPPKPGS